MLIRILLTVGHLGCLYISVIIAVRFYPRLTVSRYARRIFKSMSLRLFTISLPVVMIFLIHSSGSSPIFLAPLSLNRVLSSLTQVPQVDSTYRILSLSQILLRSSRLLNSSLQVLEILEFMSLIAVRSVFFHLFHCSMWVLIYPSSSFASLRFNGMYGGRGVASSSSALASSSC
jgi:hypothetical protein